MRKHRLVIASAFAILGSAAAVVTGQRRERDAADRLVQQLLQSGSDAHARPALISSLDELPAPVARYFRRVLVEGQPTIRSARMRQAGELRTSTTSNRWLSFTANQIVVPGAPGFVWNAKVAMPLATHLRIVDSYDAGIGAGRVSVMSAFAVAADSGTLELASGALHRYLAEAVWYPTALLPRSGVLWTPIDDRAALATLTDKGTAVSLEFRFSELGDVTAIYSPGRFGLFDGKYRQVPWEGHFRDYEVRSGLRVPTYGEVGWYDAGAWEAVWKADLIEVLYKFAA